MNKKDLHLGLRMIGWTYFLYELGMTWMLFGFEYLLVALFCLVLLPVAAEFGCWMDRFYE